MFAMHSSIATALEVTPFAELLVWHASQQPTSSWATVSSLSVDHITEENNEFGWDTGFRGGFAFKPDGFFDIKLYWTYFSTDNTEKIPLGLHLVLPQYFSGFLSEDIFFGAQQDWRLMLNMFDLEMSHQFNIRDNISLRPMIGIKAATMSQDINVLWQAELYNATEKVTSDYWGVGPNLGIGGAWDMTKNLSFMTNLSTAFMWGTWNGSDVYKRPDIIGIDGTTIKTSMSETELGTLILQYFVGLNWSPEILPGLTVGLGYEMQYWANQVRIITFQQLPTHGDLTIQGATCRFSFDFY